MNRAASSINKQKAESDIKIVFHNILLYSTPSKLNSIDLPHK